MKRKNIIGRGDILLIACLLVIGITAALILPLLLPPGQAVSVELDGERIALLPLDTDTRLTVDPDGDGKDVNVLVIADGRAYVESADCRDGICVSHPPISKEGETVICLPHRLVLRIVSDGDGGM